MRTFLFLLSTLYLLPACSKEEPSHTQQQTVTKKLELHVHAALDYTTASYSNVSASVTVHIAKINLLTGQRQPLWDSTITRRAIAAYPVLPQKVLIEKYYPVRERVEILQLGYNIIYVTSSGTVQTTATEDCVPGEKSSFLDVSI